MTDRTDVESFLRDFRVKKRVWGVIYEDDRGKNAQALIDLEIKPIDRDEILESLSVENYCQGPLSHQLYPTDAWVFGISIMKHEVYIKISMGVLNSSVICISFHVAEYPLQYPFNNGLITNRKVASL